MSYYDRANDVFMKAYGRYDITFDHGKGVYLYDINILMLYVSKCIV